MITWRVSRLVSKPKYYSTTPKRFNHVLDAVPTVSSSQIIRYAIHADRPKNNNDYDTTEPKLDQQLELIFARWNHRRTRYNPSGTDFREGEELQAFPFKRLIQLPGGLARPVTDLHKVANLRELQLWYEQNFLCEVQPSVPPDALKEALVNCEKAYSSLEILSLLNALIYKYGHLSDFDEDSHGKPGPLLVFGLYYASQSLLAPAFRHHLNALDCCLTGKDAEDVISSLLRAVRTHRLANPAYDASLMLRLVSGETLAANRPHDEFSEQDSIDKTLMDKIQLNHGLHSLLVELLLELGSSKSHEIIWESLLEDIVTAIQNKDNPSTVVIDEAYKCIAVFLKADRKEYADRCLKEMAEMAGSFPPSLRVSLELAEYVNEEGLTVPPTVEAHLKQAEDIILGEDLMSKEVLRLDDDTVDFSVVKNLLTQIRKHGTSLTASKIALVIDALSDCAVSKIPLFSQSVEEGRVVDFAWTPGWIPVISPMESESFIQTLGLLRARIIHREILVSFERCRYLVQLGHLVQRERTIIEQNESYQENASNPWRKTGYLVGFDRISAEFLLIYVGEYFDLIDPEHHQQEQSLQDEEKNYPSVSFMKHQLIGSLSALAMPADAQDLNRDISSVVHPVKNAAARYHFDLDPGDSLQP